MVPATRLTVIVVGEASGGTGTAGAGGTEVFRVKLIVPGIVPLVGVTVNTPGGTPGVVTVAV